MIMHRDRGGASNVAAYRVVPAQIPHPKPDHSFTRRPKSKLALFWWKRRIWIESTFALTVYEPWEKVVVLTVFAILCTAIMIVFFRFLPRQLILMRKRSIYYLWGEDPDVNDTMLWQHLGLTAPTDVGYNAGGMRL
ncbi:hypothetical protein CPB84DRAFT_1767459 [Gymnopilus junonius]|uniref:Uncharacterized protein n=1 Tax=Gymnopilus junonius TaxID=109634 RepID=A0A9P5NVM4_GYMJU|nr:hypothetical protein CPB84DRAFT_1767459 [Gymnopilus junonius]